MKKGTIAGLTLAVAAILALCALAAYLTFLYREDLLPASSYKTESEANAAILALHETAAEETAPEETQKADEPFDSLIIWVGDSRTLGMKEALANNDLFIGAAGEGYNWFSEIGLPEMADAIKQYPSAPVVINFGVNDYGNMDKYMTLYDSLLAEYPDTHFYFLSVNPIDPEVCSNITNEEIADFNEHLYRLFPDTYLDSYTQILAKSIIPFDGVHYTADDYRFIYDFAVERISYKEAS